MVYKAAGPSPEPDMLLLVLWDHPCFLSQVPALPLPLPGWLWVGLAAGPRTMSARRAPGSSSPGSHPPGSTGQVSPRLPYKAGAGCSLLGLVLCCLWMLIGGVGEARVTGSVEWGVLRLAPGRALGRVQPPSHGPAGSEPSLRSPSSPGLPSSVSRSVKRGRGWACWPEAGAEEGWGVV